MKITKLGHCCLLIEEKGVRLLTDPGSFTADSHQNTTGLDAILFTHEHADHYHLDSLKILLKNNPIARIVCNTSVAELLQKEGIVHEVVEHEKSLEIKGVVIEGFGEKHAQIHTSIPIAANTGYFIAGRLWYPGDGFFLIQKTPEIIALPMAGPWMKLSEALDYALALKPKKCFPVHDFMLNEIGHSTNVRIGGGVLTKNGIEYVPLEIAKEYEF